jgi:hypothetical protein
MKGVRSAAVDLGGECLFELPWALLSDCSDIEGLLAGAVLVLILFGVLIVLLGLVTLVSEAFSAGNFQQLGLK